jgi:hypothetical protein
MEPRHLESATQILKEMKYMTLATVCEDGSPWNTPVAPTPSANLIFRWGSNEESVHSQNIRREKRVFVVIYDSHAPEGAGEGIYMKGEAEELNEYEETLKMYRFIPEKIWINDEENNEDGSFKKDIRVELDIEELRKALSK